MSDFKNMFRKELVDMAIEANTEEEAFKIVAEKLKEKGMVNDQYLNGITQREKEFPTGLITQHLNVALPHSDPEYVKEAFVFIARLKNPVKVRQMGDNQEMEVNNLFFLGIKDGKKQSGLLASFMNLFMNEKFVSDYLAAKDADEVYALFEENI